MLSKKYRFKNFDFGKFQKSFKISDDIFILMKIDPENNTKKFSVVVDKKNIKKAVIRNKIKRKIYEIIRLNLDKIPIGYYLIKIKEDISKEKFKDLENKLMNLFKNVPSNFCRAVN
jgi:ribonuclease P protein component